MIESIVREIAAEKAILPSSVKLIDGMRLGIRDAYLLKMTCDESVVSTLIHKASLASAEEGANERIRHEINLALSRLLYMMAHEQSVHHPPSRP